MIKFNETEGISKQLMALLKSQCLKNLMTLKLLERN